MSTTTARLKARPWEAPSPTTLETPAVQPLSWKQHLNLYSPKPMNQQPLHPTTLLSLITILARGGGYPQTSKEG